ncbi:MAG: hypothetical protein MZU91_12495 [Desulfosudis oleivorans]|nr:hypothetical protein [Desulfosudis oleivorans]
MSAQAGSMAASPPLSGCGQRQAADAAALQPPCLQVGLAQQPLLAFVDALAVAGGHVFGNGLQARRHGQRRAAGRGRDREQQHEGGLHACGLGHLHGTRRGGVHGPIVCRAPLTAVMRANGMPAAKGRPRFTCRRAPALRTPARRRR